MVSRSYSNLLDLASGNFHSFSREKTKRFPRVATVTGVLSELDTNNDENNSNNVCSDALSSITQDRIIIVGNQLPIKSYRYSVTNKLTFTWDNDSLLLQLKDGMREDMEVIYIGCLPKEAITTEEQDDVSSTLLEHFKCVPAYIPPVLSDKYYHSLCKQHLWPLFHYMLPLTHDLGGRFDHARWQAYLSVNKQISN